VEVTVKKNEPSAEVELPQFRMPEGTQMPILPGEDFNSLAKELVAATDSRELLKVKHDLIGVPMILTAFAFRYGAKKPGAEFGDYLSTEAVTFDNRRVVFNDSSTGIRLQVATWIHSTLKAAQKDPSADLFDPAQPWQTWEYDVLDRYGAWRGEGDKLSWLFTALPDGRPIRFLARHGLRVSEYVHSDSGSEAETFYLD
jgi:hypothetical protein